jgi:misacylated tRNA(Ala) deacylase
MEGELFREDAYLEHCEARIVAVGDGALVLDRTVFYARGGGQAGDRGRLVLPDGSAVEITDTIRDAESGRILHVLAEGAVPPPAGTGVTAVIDWPRRHRLMRMHSALHLLCRAVDAPVTGGQVDDGKGRLDFDAGDRPVEREAIEARIAAWIAEDHAIRPLWVDEAELEARPELVRTLSVRPPRGQGRVRLVEIEGVDLQACGGTHVRSTAEIGAVAVTKIESKGRRNRRVSLALGDAGDVAAAIAR